MDGYPFKWVSIKHEFKRTLSQNLICADTLGYVFTLLVACSSVHTLIHRPTYFSNFFPKDNIGTYI